MSTVSLRDAGVAFCEMCDNVVPTVVVKTVGLSIFDYPEVCSYCGEEV